MWTAKKDPVTQVLEALAQHNSDDVTASLERDLQRGTRQIKTSH